MDPDIETSRAKILALNEAVDVLCIYYTTNWEFFPDYYYTTAYSDTISINIFPKIVSRSTKTHQKTLRQYVCRKWKVEGGL